MDQARHPGRGVPTHGNHVPAIALGDKTLPKHPLQGGVVNQFLQGALQTALRGGPASAQLPKTVAGAVQQAPVVVQGTQKRLPERPAGIQVPGALLQGGQPLHLGLLKEILHLPRHLKVGKA